MKHTKNTLSILAAAALLAIAGPAAAQSAPNSPVYVVRVGAPVKCPATGCVPNPATATTGGSGGSTGSGGSGSTPAIGFGYPNPNSIDFGTQPYLVTSTPARTVYLSNAGTGPLSISSVETTNPSNFGISSGCVGQTLAPEQSCAVNVSFTPSADGSITGSLRFVHNGSSGLTSVSLSGVGAQVLGNFVNVESGNNTANFGTVTVGNTVTRTFSFTNVGHANATGIAATVTGDALAITSNSCGTPGAPGSVIALSGTCSLSVAYSPTTAGTLSNAAVNIAVANSLASPYVVSLIGSAAPANVVASGGTELQPGDGYKYHIFSAGASTFTVTSNSSSVPIEILAVAGGGAGGSGRQGNNLGGGGGAGGVKTLTAVLAAGNYNVNVGAGGLANTAGNPSTAGGNSTVSGPGTALTANGGGYGAGTTSNAGSAGSGGSGGGSAGGSGGSGIAGQGYAGGNNLGGGGGAGGAGQSKTTINPCGAGGAGIYMANFTVAGSPAGWYASGGGCGASGPSGGNGGGGAGATASAPAVAGQAGTGGGGGGAYGSNAVVNGAPLRLGASGGSGIVIVRYPYQ